MDILIIIGFTVAACGAAATGAMFPPGEWYERLTKPTWTPPNWLFPLAWTALYAMLVYVAFRLTRLPMEQAAVPLALWAGQIAVNGLWTPVFMGLRRLGGGMVVIVVMWLTVAGLLVSSLLVDWVSGVLLVPYLVWVSFAGALNFWIWRANPAQAVPQGA